MMHNKLYKFKGTTSRAFQGGRNIHFISSSSLLLPEVIENSIKSASPLGLTPRICSHANLSAPRFTMSTTFLFHRKLYIHQFRWKITLLGKKQLLPGALPSHSCQKIIIQFTNQVISFYSLQKFSRATKHEHVHSIQHVEPG